MFKKLFVLFSLLTVFSSFPAFSRPLIPGTEAFEGIVNYPRDRMNEYDKILSWLPKLSKYCVPLIYFHATAFNTTAFSLYDDFDRLKWHSFYGHLDGGLLIYYDFSDKHWVGVINPEDYYKRGHIVLEKSARYFIGSTALDVFNQFASWALTHQQNVYSSRYQSYNQNNPSFPIPYRNINSIGDFYILNVPILFSQINLTVRYRSNLPYPIAGRKIKLNFKCPAAP